MTPRPMLLLFSATFAGAAAQAGCSNPSPRAVESDTVPVAPSASAPAAQPEPAIAIAEPAAPVVDAPASVPEPDPIEEERPALDIEYVPTPHNVVAKMLSAAKVTKTDVVYDLGCGDGRLLVAAAKTYGAKGFGFDLDPVRVEEARANVKKAGVEHLVTIEQKNIFDVDVSPATVVTLYLLPELNVRLIPQLQKLAPGSRIISHDFDMQGVDHEDAWTIVADHHRPPPKKRDHYVYKWTAPLKVEAPIPE